MASVCEATGGEKNQQLVVGSCAVVESLQFVGIFVVFN